MKKLVVVFALVMLGAFVWAGGQGEGDEVVAPEDMTLDGPATISFWNGGGLEWDPATVVNMERFSAEYPDVTIDVNPVPFGVHLSRIVAASVAGGSRYDVSELYDGWIVQMKEAGWLMPLDSILSDEERSELPDWMLDFMTGSDGHIYTIPHFINMIAFVYNTDLLAEAGFDRPPETWEETLEYGKALTKDLDGDGVVDQWGLAFTAWGPSDVTSQFQVFLYQQEGSLFDDQGRAAFNDAKGRAALQFMVDCIDEGITWPGIVSSSSEEVSRMYIQGKVAMAISWGFLIDRGLNNEESIIKDAVGAAQIPRPAGGVNATYPGVWYMGVSAGAPEPAAALTFVDFMTSIESAKSMLLNEPGNFVGYGSAYTDPAVAADLPFADVLNAVVGSARSEAHPLLNECKDILAEEIQAALAGSQSVDEALANAETRINELSGF